MYLEMTHFYYPISAFLSNRANIFNLEWTLVIFKSKFIKPSNNLKYFHDLFMSYDMIAQPPFDIFFHHVLPLKECNHFSENYY